MINSSISNCGIISIPTMRDCRGDLGILEQSTLIPFHPKRTYFIYDVPDGEGRGGHAHKQLEQVMVAIHGSFRVDIDDGLDKASYTLSKPTEGLYISPGIWREIWDFQGDAICLVTASENYQESDYIRDRSIYDSIYSANK